MLEVTFIKDSIESFEKLKLQAEAAIDQIDEESFFAFSSFESNSIAILVKHIGGNLKSRWRDFFTTDGEKPDRNRDDEFEIYETDTEESLIALWDEGWSFLINTLESLSPEDLSKTVKIRGEDYTVSKAILRSLGHTSFHIGQIIYLAKFYAAEDWSNQSIAKGESEQFNQKMMK